MPPLSSSVNFSQTRASVFLDLLRGTAAVLVLLEHWRNTFFVDYPQLASHSSVIVISYVLSSAGHQSVIIFFVLSGYLISGSVFRSFARGTWGWKTYLTHRLVRLWVVLVPGLVLCAVWDAIALHYQLAPAVYAGLGANHMTPDVHRSFTLSAFVGNLFFLQTLVVPIFGSDSALWSLANEFWYYLLFPLALVSLRRQFSGLARFVCATLFLLIAWFVRDDILPLFPVWLCGTALVFTPPPRVGNKVRIVAVMLYVPLVFVFAKVHRLPLLLQDYLFGAATFLFLWILLSATDGARDGAFFTRFSRSLAGFSYTLYVAHMPFILLIAAILVGDRRWVLTPRNISESLVVLTFTLLYAYVLAAFTEFRTQTFRRMVERKVGITKA